MTKGVSFEPRLNDLVLVRPTDLGTRAPELIGMGEVLLLLISEWSRWLERRVETVRFLDADTVSRNVSVDFISPQVPTFLARTNEDVTFVPLGTLLKRELVSFDLRDEEGRPMPLLSGRQNGPWPRVSLHSSIGSPDEMWAEASARTR